MTTGPDRGALPFILADPGSAGREFIRGGVSHGEIASMAARLLELTASGGQGPLCLATGDRATIAAALLASLAGGPVLLLPHALSPRGLAHLHEENPYTLALGDPALEYPPGVRVIAPPSGGAAPPLPCPDPETDLLRIFTGGSTGTPRTWSKSGQNIFAEAAFLASLLEIDQHDCILATVPPLHIYGLLFTVALPLVSGASVVARSPSFPADIAESVQSNGVTVLAAVPAHYRVLADRPLASSLRIAVSSAGMLEEADNRIFCRCNRIGITEVYGSTESGGIATRCRFRGEEHFTPFATVDWQVRDSRLLVRSPYLSPDLLLEPDGFFLTADRVEESGEAGFFLKGRVDAVAKVGGKRVDLEEIRARLRACAGVEDCVVRSYADPGGRGQRIAALVQGGGLDPGRLREELGRHLEPWALPRLIRVVEQIPVWENGKYDREAVDRLLDP